MLNHLLKSRNVSISKEWKCLFNTFWIGQCLKLKICVCVHVVLSLSNRFYELLIFLPFSTVEKKTHAVRQGWQYLVPTHQVFPMFQSSPVTPANESGGQSQMQSVSMFTVVWAGFSFIKIDFPPVTVFPVELHACYLPLRVLTVAQKAHTGSFISNQ